MITLNKRFALNAVFVVFLCILSLSSCEKKVSVTASVPAHIRDGKIFLETPQRSSGQESALGLACEPIDTVKVAFVGIGRRGSQAVKRYTEIEGAKIVALCDENPAQVQLCQGLLSDAGLPPAKEYVGSDAYVDLCRNLDVDLVYIATDWLDHVPVALCAMENGHHAAIEVPSAMTVKECWDLVDMCERTRLHCTILENCCYDYFEMSTLNMAQQGLFGEIYQATGGYIHFFSDNLGNHSDPWRLDYNIANRGDNYPTHGLGPLCQVLNIHRGDKMDYLVSMDTPAYNFLKTARETRNVEECQSGDHTISLIQTHRKHLIEIQHNICCPRPYSRLHQLNGDRGFVNKYPIQQICAMDINGPWELEQNVIDSLIREYKPEFVKEIEADATRIGGHGGMDYIMDYRLIYCLRHGLPLDMDVYDCAEWSAVQELSRLSLEHGSIPVEFPDFTRGQWDVIKGFSYATE